MQFCVYCFIQERKKAKLRNPTKADTERLATRTVRGWKVPSKICNVCNALYEKECDENGNVLNDEARNALEFKRLF